MQSPAITCESISLSPTQPPRPLKPEGNADIWIVDVDAFCTSGQDAGALLTKDEQEKAAAFRRDQDRNSFIARRSALRTLLGIYLEENPAEIRFVAGPNKKPFAVQAEQKGLRFNVSHSGNFAVIAVANSETGIDIEYLKPDFKYSEVLDYSFSSTEISAVKTSADPLKAFFTMWTRKEALAKATSQGLDDQLVSIPSLDGTHALPPAISDPLQNWRVSTFVLDPGYTVSIARRPDITLRLFNFSALTKRI